MARVTGIGGVFFKCDNPQQVREWYRDHLGIPSDQYGWSFEWRDKDDPERIGFTVWNPFPTHTRYFDPSTQPFMVNFRVDDLSRAMPTP